jgi:hypothetical protein
MGNSSRVWIIAGALAVLLLLGIVGPCTCRPPVNEELARTAREAVESAREARKEAQEARERDDAAYLWPGRLKLLAVVVGVSVALAGAIVLVWLSLRHRPGDLEILSQARKLNLRAFDKPLPSAREIASQQRIKGDSAKPLERDRAPPGQ